jgi:hypothetical protein
LEAIETLLPYLDNDRSSLVVILAGYRDEMQQLIKSNPGLARRFPPDNRFIFPDLDTGQLYQVLMDFLVSHGLVPDRQTTQALQTIISSMLAQKDSTFGNAGEMRNLAESLARCHHARIRSNDLLLSTPLELADIPEYYRNFLDHPQVDIANVEGFFNDLVGLEGLKQKLKDLTIRTCFEIERHNRSPCKTGRWLYWSDSQINQ